MMNKTQSPNHPERWWDLPALFLLLVVLTTAYSRLVATGWTEDLDITRTITYLGLIAGAALGYSRLSPRWAAIFATVYGIYVIGWRVGLTLGEGLAWQERLYFISNRLAVIINNLLQQRAVPDNLLFIVLMGLVFWVLSAHAGYVLTRHAHAWSTVLPTGIALVLIHSYDAFITRRVGYLIAYLLFALLLVARLVFVRNKRRWELSHTYTPPYLGLDLVRVALALLVAILLLSWTAPALADALPAASEAWQRFKEPWRDFRNVMDNAFASLRSSVGIVSDYYGPNLALGRGNRLSNSIVFIVSVPPNPPVGTRYYWRARVYDEYDNGWISTLKTTRALPADQFDLDFPDMADNAPGDYPFAFTLGVPISTIFTPVHPVWLNRPSQAELAFNPDGTADLASLRATPPIRNGDSYTLRASLNQVTIAALRRAGRDYPEWVTERYLQLPDTVTQRTRDLALELAAGRDNPYDIAASITTFLRTNMEYSETVPPLPVDQDLVDWFLFDLKTGFCNYYASSQVVLLRLLGIPARLAVGYAEGEPLETGNGFTVRQKDTHAWPEVYFPGYGWVEFEPTAAQPVLVRPLGDDTGASDSLLPDPFPDVGDNELPFDRLQEGQPFGADAQLSLIERLRPYLFILIVLALILALALLGFWKRKEIQARLPAIPISLEKSFRRFGLQPPQFLQGWAFVAGLSPLQRAYLELNRALRRLGKPPALHHTPAERAETLGSALPPAQPPASALIREYHAATYSPAPNGDMDEAVQAGWEIRLLSYKAILRRIFTEPGERRPTRRF